MVTPERTPGDSPHDTGCRASHWRLANGELVACWSAATSGALALLGVLLGATGAYLALLAGYHDDLGTLSRVPLLHLAVTVVGVPLTAAAVGWLLAEREPSTLARQRLE
jgi:hypothetical protein